MNLLIKKGLNEIAKEVYENAKCASPEMPAGDLFFQKESIDDNLHISIFSDRNKSPMSRIGFGCLSDIDKDETYGDLVTQDNVHDVLKEDCKLQIIGTKGMLIVGRVVEDKIKSKTINTVNEETLRTELIKDNVISEDELDERIEYLKSHGITSKDILFEMVLRMIRKQKENIKKPKKLYIKPNSSKNEESLIKRILRNLVIGDPVILEGPKSVGKNVAWESISWLLNRPMEVLNCSGKMTKSEMFGSPTTDNSAKEKITLGGAKSFFKSFISKKEDDAAAEFIKNVASCMSPSIKLDFGPVTRAITSAEEKGTILIADELNLSDPNTFAGAFNSLTDKHTTSYNINGLGVVKIPTGLIVGGTQNGTGGAYVGTKLQNDATMSRFNVIRINAPTTISNILRNNKFDVEEDIIFTLDRIYKEFSKAEAKGEVSAQCLNVRGFERALAHIVLGQNIIEAVNECVVFSCKQMEEAVLKAIVEGQVS